jgi:hypothetical protein
MAYQPIQVVALLDLCREEFWIVFYHLIKHFSKPLLIVDRLFVYFTTDRQANPFAGLCGGGLSFGRMSLRHIG